MTFELEDGSNIELTGPWHSNADSLFADTGVDIRDKYSTFVVIGKDMTFNPDIMVDVVYKDEKPMIGDFHRGVKLAMALSKQMNCILYYYSQSDGGSSISSVFPDQIDVHGKRSNTWKEPERKKIEPSPKSTQMERNLNYMFKRLFKKTRVEAINEGVCIICGELANNFKDKLSEKEYGISAMCQKCQDKTFGR